MLLDLDALPPPPATAGAAAGVAGRGGRPRRRAGSRGGGCQPGRQPGRLAHGRRQPGSAVWPGGSSAGPVGARRLPGCRRCGGQLAGPIRVWHGGSWLCGSRGRRGRRVCRAVCGGGGRLCRRGWRRGAGARWLAACVGPAGAMCRLLWLLPAAGLESLVIPRCCAAASPCCPPPAAAPPEQYHAEHYQASLAGGGTAMQVEAASALVAADTQPAPGGPLHQQGAGGAVHNSFVEPRPGSAAGAGDAGAASEAAAALLQDEVVREVGAAWGAGWAGALHGCSVWLLACAAPASGLAPCILLRCHPLLLPPPTRPRQVLSFWSYYRRCGFEAEAMQQWVSQVCALPPLGQHRGAALDLFGAQLAAWGAGRAGGRRAACWVPSGSSLQTASPRLQHLSSNPPPTCLPVPPPPPPSTTELPSRLRLPRLRCTAGPARGGGSGRGAPGHQRGLACGLARRLPRRLAPCHAHRRKSRRRGGCGGGRRRHGRRSCGRILR